MAMYAIYKQTHPPTGVEFCTYCHFFGAHETNLVIAGTNQITVYRLNLDIESISGRNVEKIENKNRKMKLEFMATFSLFGNVMSIESVQLAGSSRDALLLSFRNAKLSVVEYDPGTHDLKTLSLHFFEEEELKNGLQQQNEIPIIRSDPDGRCAVMLIYGNKLVVLPFRKETTSEEETIIAGVGKSPVLASYMIDVKELDDKLANIIDLQFLHGYYEPTLLILFEPLKTWPGRVAVRQDTCAIVAISLNIHQRVHPVIWSLNNLPFDCLAALAVPKPIGGVLIFAVNSLLYLNQSVPPYGVSLNSLTETSTNFPLKPQDGVKITLDCCQATFISHNKIVISLRGGELYVLTLITDGMRSVRSFNFDKAAASVLTTCICLCEDGYLFLGSRLGNSLLLKYTEKIQDTLSGLDASGKLEDHPPTKKKRLDTLGDWMATDVALIEEDDELEVYGNEAHAGTQISSYTFEVCDSIMNIGPCGNISMGEPAFLSEEFSNREDPDLELVSTSGYSKNGALSILQRSIRPQVVTTYDLPGFYDMWTVIAPHNKSAGKSGLQESKSQEMNAENDIIELDSEKEKKEEVDISMKKDAEINQEVLSNSHAFLILSRDDSSMILQTGQEIMELDHSGFSTQAPTVFAGNIGDNAYILQVSPMGVRLLQGVNQLQHIPLDVGSPIVHASVSDPYAIIMSESGLVILMILRLDSFGSSARLAVSRPQLSQTSKILTLSAYKDVSGMFSTSPKEETATPVLTRPQDRLSKPSVDNETPLEKTRFDDEDELLYGESDISSIFTPIVLPNPAKTKTSNDLPPVKEVKPTYWAVICRENGVLEIFSLPDFKLCYLVKNFPMGPKVLVDSIQMTTSTGTSGTDKQSDKINESLPVVKEVLLIGMGNKNCKPHMLAIVEDDLLIYEAFPYFETQTENHLKLRFKKVPHNLLIRERKTTKAKKKAETTEQLKTGNRVCQMRYFQDIASYSGVFICGHYPHWLFMTSRGILRTHPMGIDGFVTCFSEFHNINCPKGFLYFNKQNELRICALPTHLSYDAPWPVRKVPLRCTPHFITYHLESKTYCVVTSVQEPCTQLIKMSGDDKEFEDIERDDRFIYSMTDKFSLQLISPVSWDMIPNTKIDMEEYEHVTSLKNVALKFEGTISGLKGYLAIATNYSYGEEVATRGRILIFDVIEVVPEPGQPLTKNKIKTIYSKEQKGPVTSLEQVCGYLLSAIGQKIYIWCLKDADLVGVAFIDTQIYIHSVVSIKNIILIADICKNISLLRYQEESKTLSLVSRDNKRLEVYSVEFFVDNTQLGFLVSDAEKNLILYMYQPEARESHGGQRLLRKADINIGSIVNTFFRIRCKLTEHSLDKKSASVMEKRHITMFGSLDGSLGLLLPVSEKNYRRLLMLQNILYIHLPHTAGLNPRAYRLIRHSHRMLINPHKNILDGELLSKYIHLSVNERLELAKKIGTTNEQIMDDLIEIDRSTAHF